MCKLPAVRALIESGNHAAFQRALDTFTPDLHPPCLTAFMLSDIVKYVFNKGVDVQLQVALFLLPYVDEGRSAHISWLWTAPMPMVDRPLWWYALMRRGWSPYCRYTDPKVQRAFAEAKETWDHQKHQALLLYVLSRPLLGRDVARLLAETILKMMLF